MKRFSVISKYLVFSALLILLFTVLLAKVFDVSNESLFAAIAVLCAFSVLSVLFVNKEIRRPLVNLYDYSRKLKLPVDSNPENDDFDRKADELNQLIGDLDALKAGSVLNREIYTTISELSSIAQRTLHEINTAKVFRINRNEFMGNVAHELRTPIFAIQLSLETLIDGAIRDDNVNMDFLARAMNQTRRLKELVDDLISISKFETGVKLSMRYFPIGKAVGDIVNELSKLAEKKNIELHYADGHSDDLTVFGDEQRLRQVMVNLIDNAIKYTPQNGKVDVSLDIREKDLSVIVQDTGVGIPQKDLSRIFERFYRVDKARSRDVGGSGLGLSIVKHILEAHSSLIKVESEVDKGTKFEFVLKR